jgi:3-hydroxyisobutyrate dehydrogenase-like beta-hydroxyacid dehydrogenase
VATKPIGIIGLGLMGEVYARRLLDAGRAVTGYDVDAAKSERLAHIGGKAADSVAEVAQACDTIILAVFNTDQCEEVADAIVAARGDGSHVIVLCTSTVDPDRIAALGARVVPRGLRFLETPVSGTSEQVRRGEGVGLIGGDLAVMEDVDDILTILFPRRYHVGKVGDGGRTKLSINLILGLNRAALAEGLVFARRLGLDLAAFLPIARESAAYSQIMDVKGQKMLSGEFAPEGRIRQTLKDVHLMLQQAEQHGQDLPMLKVHRDLLESCVRAGDGDNDNSGFIREIDRRRTDKAAKVKAS